MHYVEGVSDALGVLAPGRYCPPAGASLADVTGAVQRYLQAHPQDRQYSAASTTALALVTVYPCRTAQGGANQSTR
jgi:hypothetical protein